MNLARWARCLATWKPTRFAADVPLLPSHRPRVPSLPRQGWCPAPLNPGPLQLAPWTLGDGVLSSWAEPAGRPQRGVQDRPLVTGSGRAPPAHRARPGTLCGRAAAPTVHPCKTWEQDRRPRESMHVRSNSPDMHSAHAFNRCNSMGMGGRAVGGTGRGAGGVLVLAGPAGNVHLGHGRHAPTVCQGWDQSGAGAARLASTGRHRLPTSPT